MRSVKIFNDVISMRCAEFYQARPARVVDSGLVFAALPRVRARCGALHPAAPHFQKSKIFNRSFGVAPRIVQHNARRCACANFLKVGAMSAENEFTNVRGTVKFFNVSKGFGFLVRDDNGVDVFVHCTDLRPSLQLLEGQAVTFDVETTKRGLRAVNVALA